MFSFGCTNQECNIDEISDDDEASTKSSKDKKSNGPDSGKASNLIFKITSKVPYKTVMKGNPSCSNLWFLPHLFQFQNASPDLNNASTVTILNHTFCSSKCSFVKG